MTANNLAEGRTHSYIVAIHHAGLSSQSDYPLQPCGSLLVVRNSTGQENHGSGAEHRVR